jgi:hypothetical protein
MWRWTSQVSRRVFFTRIAQSCAVCTTGVVVLGRSKTYGQAIAPLYTPKAPIPKDSFKTWSLFLINNPQWVVAESDDKVKKLYDQFEAFGKAIGPNHVAVWFWSENIWEDSFYYKAVDVIRSAGFCEKLNLAPSSGPYILVTGEYPGTGLINDSSTFLPRKLQNYYIVSLNNKSADEIMQLLTRVADKVIANRLSELNTQSPDYWIVWRQTYEAIRDFLSKRQMTVTIKTPVSEIQVK